MTDSLLRQSTNSNQALITHDLSRNGPSTEAFAISYNVYQSYTNVIYNTYKTGTGLDTKHQPQRILINGVFCSANDFRSPSKECIENPFRRRPPFFDVISAGKSRK